MKAIVCLLLISIGACYAKEPIFKDVMLTINNKTDQAILTGHIYPNGFIGPNTPESKLNIPKQESRTFFASMTNNFRDIGVDDFETGHLRASWALARFFYFFYKEPGGSGDYYKLAYGATISVWDDPPQTTGDFAFSSQASGEGASDLITSKKYYTCPNPNPTGKPYACWEITFK